MRLISISDEETIGYLETGKDFTSGTVYALDSHPKQKRVVFVNPGKCAGVARLPEKRK